MKNILEMAGIVFVLSCVAFLIWFYSMLWDPIYGFDAKPEIETPSEEGK